VSDPISILVVDDHAMVRRMLTRRLDEETDMRVVASAGNASEAIVEAASLKPDIILMDIDMPGISCFQAVREIQICSPESRMIFLSAFFHDRHIEQAVAARAWGYIVKNESDEAVVAAIRAAVSGVPHYSPEVQARLVVEDGVARVTASPSSRASTLSDREKVVLRYLVRGMARKEIARAMQISTHTVNRHVANLMDKIGIHDRLELARYAIREGLEGA